MSNRIRRVPLAVKVHSFEAEIGGEKEFLISSNTQDGRVVADAMSHDGSLPQLSSSSANVSNEL